MKTRKAVDRRSGQDRRQVYDIKYFESGGVENRRSGERRGEPERRTGWVRIDEWSSIRQVPNLSDQMEKVRKIR